MYHNHKPITVQIEKESVGEVYVDETRRDRKPARHGENAKKACDKKREKQDRRTGM